MFENRKEVQKMADGMGIKMQGLDSIPEIKISPILFEDGDDLMEAEGMKLTFSAFDDGRIEPLAKVSDQYALVQHWEAIGQVLTSFKGLPEFNLDKVDILTTDDGGRCFTRFNSSVPITMAPGDDIFPRITLINSCDTSKRFGLSWGAVRQICTNGMVVADDRIEGGNTKKLHKLGSLSLEAEIANFVESFGKASESLDIWKEYANLELQKNQLDQVFETMAISEKQGEEILALTMRGDNKSLNNELLKGTVDGWTAYNAVTQFLTDTVDNPSTQMERGIKASQAFDFLLKG